MFVVDMETGVTVVEQLGRNDTVGDLKKRLSRQGTNCPINQQVIVRNGEAMGDSETFPDSTGELIVYALDMRNAEGLTCT